MAKVARVVPSVTTGGLTLSHLARVVFENDSNYEIWRNSRDETRFSVDEFVKIVDDQVRRFGSLIVNYHMSTLGQTPAGGHFSLVAGLARTLSIGDEWFVLLLDCWPETPVAWVPIAVLYRAMNTSDPDAGGEYRGLLKRI